MLHIHQGFNADTTTEKPHSRVQPLADSDDERGAYGPYAHFTYYRGASRARFARSRAFSENMICKRRRIHTKS